MKLSEIVAYLNLLDSLDVAYECNEATGKLSNIAHVVRENSELYELHSNTITATFENLKQEISKFSNGVEKLREQLRHEISSKDEEYLQASHDIWINGMAYDTNKVILNRRMRIDSEDDLFLRGRLKGLTDWRIPGMIMRPGVETYIEDMVPLDPLYVVDHNEALMDPTISKFTPEYQRRLRKYVIDDKQPGLILGQLPNKQFGLIFAYHFFNHKPLELIKRYLTEMYDKLRPGGVILMTYNNCDLAHGVIRAENAWMLYTPKRLILEHAHDLGLELETAYDGKGDVSWLELRRPGDITSIRGGQTLAEVVAKTN